MANTLTDLIPDLYEALDIVSRELVGFIPSVNTDHSIERAAIGEDVIVPVTGAEAAIDVTPAVTAPDDGDGTVAPRKVTISKSRGVPVRFNGEETKGLQNAGTYQNIIRDRFAQGMRTLVNELEADVALEALSASRAVGTAGTTPFGTKDDLDDFAAINEALDINGAPSSGRQLVVGSAAKRNLQGVQTGLLQKVNEAGTASALRMGVFEQIHDLSIRTSAQVQTNTAGSGSGFLVNNAGGYAAGATEIILDTGTGDIDAGNTISFAGHSTEYTIVEGTSGAGTVTIAEPGLLAAVADDEAVTVGDDYVGNAGFHRNAIQLATRMPAQPDGGDSADDILTIQDPVSGLGFEISVYRQFKQVLYLVSLSWGYKMTKPEHAVILRG